MIWLFAGGGEAELDNREAGIKGIVHFFEKHFSKVCFIRITPVRNKRPPHRVKSNPGVDALGKTGSDLAKQIKAKLEDKVKYKETCDLIFILDDLDCFCNEERTAEFNKIIDQAGNGEFKGVKRIIGFAAPELESWIIADWDNTIAKHIDFRQNHQVMRDFLIENGVCFDAPEGFSHFDAQKQSCHDKLSDILVESSFQKNGTVYSKSKHTPTFLYVDLNPEVVLNKCPIFKDFYTKP